MVSGAAELDWLDVVQDARIVHLFRSGRKSRLILGMENSAQRKELRRAIWSRVLSAPLLLELQGESAKASKALT